MSDILEKYKKDNLPYGGRLPTMEEIDRAIEQPEEADEKMQRYLELRPEFVENWKRIKKLLQGDL
jgi:hypothetical protein